MSIEFSKFKKPLGSTVLYAEVGENQYRPLRLDPDTQALKVLTYATDGTNIVNLKTDSSGRAEVLPASSDGTEFSYLKVDTNKRLEILPASNDGNTYSYLKVNPENRLEVLPAKRGDTFTALNLDDDNNLIVKDALSPRIVLDFFNLDLVEGSYTSLNLPVYPMSIYRIYIVLDSDAKFVIKRVIWGYESIEYLNQAQPLRANCAYIFDIMTSQLDEDIAIGVDLGGGGGTIKAKVVKILEIPK